MILIFFSFYTEAQIFRLPSSVYIWEGFERNPTKRVSSYPYVSGDTFRAFCDHVFDEVHPSIDTSLIEPGDTIFIVADFCDYFFSHVYEHIKCSFIIVSHNRDDVMPGRFAKYLDDEKIIAWFALNIDREHPKLMPIPIGIANGYWPHGNTAIIQKIQRFNFQKDMLLYAGYTSPTHPSRVGFLNFFRNKSYCCFSHRKNYSEYLTDLGNALFVLSPRGNGIDCHRTWEALLMGAIPIVPETSIKEIYKDLPIIQVCAWQEVTEVFLTEKYEQISKGSWNLDKLYADYWFQKINERKRLFLKNYKG